MNKLTISIAPVYYVFILLNFVTKACKGQQLIRGGICNQDVSRQGVE